MKTLLSNQTLRIDYHHYGEVKWDDPSQDIHLHKTSNNNANIQYDIRVPLNSDREATISVNGRTHLSSVPSKIKKEVNKAFNRDDKRNAFIGQLRSELETRGCLADNMAEVAEKIERTFGIEQRALVDQFAKETCSIRLLEQNQIHYQTIINYRSNQIYIGQFSLGNMIGIHSVSRQQWETALIGHLNEIFNCESKPELERMLNGWAREIQGIGKWTVDNALMTFCTLYDIPD